MREEEIDKANGETAWKVMQDLFVKRGDGDIIPKIEMMVKTLGAEGTYAISKFDQSGMPDEVLYLIKQALNHLQSQYASKAHQQ